MNRCLIACLTGLILFLMFPIGVAAQQGGYVGFGGGSSMWDFDPEGFDQFDDSDTSFKLFVGFSISENAAIELAYADLGEVSASISEAGVGSLTVKEEATALSVALAGQLPLGEAFALFGKVGFAFWDAEGTFDLILEFPFAFTDSGSGDETGFDPLFGFGLVINATDALAFRLEFERYLNVGDGLRAESQLFFFDFPDTDVDVLSASVLFRF